MAGEEFCAYIQTLGVAFDGDRTSNAGLLDRLHEHLRGLPRDERDRLRRDMARILAALAGLESRLIGSDGPIDTAV
jgi:hypothetical protein